MTQYESTKIRQYENLIREIINSIISEINLEELSNNGKTLLSEMQNIFSFNNINGLQQLNSCLDIIGDSQIAIIEFVNSRHLSYLSIYGVLSAIYIQQQSIIKIAKILKINNFKKEFDVLKITFLRHCVSAHPVNYNFNGTEASYKLARYSLFQNGNLVIIDELNNFKDYDIYLAINEYIIIAEEKLNNISKKFINNISTRERNESIEFNNILTKIK